MEGLLQRTVFAVTAAVLLGSIGGFVYFSENKAFLVSVVAVTTAVTFFRAEYSFYGIAFLTPLLYRSPNVFGTNNYSVAELIVLATLFSWTVSQVFSGRFKLGATALDVPLVLFLLFTLVSVIQPLSQVEFQAGFFGSDTPLYSLKVFVDTVVLVLLYFYVTRRFRRRFLGKTVALLMAGLIITSSYGLYQYFKFVPQDEWFLKTSRISVIHLVKSTFNHHNIFGAYLILLFPLFISLSGYYKGPAKYGLITLCLIPLLALLSSHSRSAWLGFAASLMAFSSLRERKVFHGVILIFFILTFLFLVFPDFREITYVDRMLKSGGQIGERIGCYGKVVDGILENPMGIGVGTFRQKEVCGIYHHAHNIFLHIAVERGVFALSVFLIFLFVFFRQVYSRKLKDAYATRVVIGFSAGILAILVQGLLDYPFYDQRIGIMFFLIVGIVVKLKEEGESTSPNAELIP
ncbi:MAG: O-antigen ligase family protein [Methanobacteriota archaeon]